MEKSGLDKILNGEESPLKDKDVAQRLNISRAYVHKLADSGLLKAIRWTLDGDDKVNKRFLLSDVRRFLEEHYS